MIPSVFLSFIEMRWFLLFKRVALFYQNVLLCLFFKFLGVCCIIVCCCVFIKPILGNCYGPGVFSSESLDLIRDKISFVGVAHLTRGGRSCSWALYRWNCYGPRASSASNGPTTTTLTILGFCPGSYVVWSGVAGLKFQVVRPHRWGSRVMVRFFEI